MAQTQYGDINQRTAAWAATEMLAHAEPILVLSKYGQTKPVPKNKAKSVKFRRPIPFPALSAPITEGATPTAQQMQYEDVSATLAQYGVPVEITDQVADLSEDPVLKDASMLCGEQAAETNEMVVYGVIKAGTNVFYSNGSARNAVNTKMTTTIQRRVTRALKAARAKKVTSMIGASVKYGTEPVDAAFLGFGHTDLEADIRDMTGFVPVEKYGSMKPLPFEVGKVEDVRYILSPLLNPFADAGGLDGDVVLSTTGTNADVYPIIIIGKDAYGQVPLKGANAITPMVLNPGTPSKSDPLGQRGYVSWKAYFTAVILNQSWMARVEVAASVV